MKPQSILAPSKHEPSAALAPSLSIHLDVPLNSIPLNPYNSVQHAFAHFRLVIPQSNKCEMSPKHWWLTKYVKGQLRGLPNSFGRICATNGVLCLIDRGGDVGCIGHKDNWLVDEEEMLSECASSVVGKKKPTARSGVSVSSTFNKSLCDDLLEGLI